MTDISTIPATAVDISNIISTATQGLAVALLTVVAAWARSHLNDKQAQQTVITAAENAVSYAENRLGVKADHPYTVPVASAVGKMALSYMNAHVGGAVKQLGLDDAGVSRLIVAKMPDIAGGGIDEGTFSGIVASASGKAPAPADYSKLLEVLAPVMEQAAAKVLADHYAATAAKPPATATAAV
jgi:hypothetical protein